MEEKDKDLEHEEQPAQPEKDKGGRPPFVITEEIIKQAEGLAMRGLTKQQIADALGMGESTLYEKQKEYPKFAEALKRGTAKGIAAVTGKLLEKVNMMDTASIIFYLKCKAGWREGQIIEMTGADGAPLLPALTVTFVDSNDDSDDSE